MPIYSNSRISSFESCPLKYKYQYIDRIEKEKEGIEAFLGSRFHEVMERIYKDCGFKIYSLEEILGYYEIQWTKNWHDEISIVRKNMTAENYFQLGKKFITDYYQRYQPFNQSKVLGLEKMLPFNLDQDGKYRMQGYIDRISEKEDGIYEIHDYKTSGTLPFQSYLDQDRQLALYQVAIQQAWSDIKEVKLIWHFVAFDKEFQSTRTPEQLEQVKEDTISLINQIEKATEFQPVQSGLCGWCDFLDICPLFKHQVKVEALPEEEFIKDDGVSLVNEYSRLVFQKKKLQMQIKELEEEIEKLEVVAIKYAEREGITAITGTEGRLSVNKKEKVQCPSKNSPEREKLEEIIKKMDKWDQVSTLDAYALEKIILLGIWTPEEISGISGLINRVTEINVRLSKLKDMEGD